jgi:hypothetical protein
MTRESAFKHRVRARMAKTGESYATARARLDTRGGQDAVDTGADVLHVTNGDSTVELLAAAAVTSPILPWRDILHDGPVPGGLSDAELRRIRAGFLAPAGSAFNASSVDRSLAERDQLLDDCAADPDKQLVLWFEADLYDQLQIIQILDRLRRHQVDPGRIALVSAGEFPGIAHFGGLGQLQPDDLLRLREDEIAVTAESLELAETAWKAFTAPDPSGLAAIARTQSSVLRHLGEAFGRLMQEYPSGADGLSLTQRRLLLAVEDGATTAGEAFRELGRRERRPFLGDLPCFHVLAGLGSGRQPLLALGTAAEFGRRPVELTETGRDVLAGRADHLLVNGIDRWIGGVHLSDADTAWRYDERREALRAR